MPFTPYHMGPGILIKALLQGSYSLMVFGWAQIVMDVQPLIVIITGQGHLHGFTHTYIGATLLAIFSALSGKYLSEIGLYIIGLNRNWQVKISWWVAFVSAFIGTLSHVLLDSIMHGDLEPFFPLSNDNPFLRIVSIETLHWFCLGAGAVGTILYWWIARANSKEPI